MAEIIPTLLITGPPGAGKTTIGAEISAVLHFPPVPHAFVDVDALAWCFPPPFGDHFQQGLALRNLQAVWRNHQAAGATHLILARVVEALDELDGYRRAVPGADITLVRLRAPLEVLEQRIRDRRSDQDPTWHVERARELAPIMDKDAFEHLLIETAGRFPREIAEEIVKACGWPENI